MGREHVLLVFVWFACVEVAVLEDDGGVAEDEIDGAVDVAFAVELAEGMNVEGVLVAHEAALVECREISPAPKGYRLVFAWACCVLKRNALGYEPVSHNS